MYRALQSALPGYLRRHVLHFETVVEESIAAFAGSLHPDDLVLDAGAGECTHEKLFTHGRYVAVDLAVGNSAWNYGMLDVIADLSTLPFRSSCFDACINVVTLEHLREPSCALREIQRTLKPGGRLLIIAPQEWEVHQAPHDYFRYTRHGLRYLLEKADFTEIKIEPVGGYFRLMSRRLFNGIQFFRGIWSMLALIMLAPPALLLPLLDPLDEARDFTLGYVGTATKTRDRLGPTALTPTPDLQSSKYPKRAATP